MKRIKILLLIILLTPILVFAQELTNEQITQEQTINQEQEQEVETVKTTDRESLANLGVNKKWKITDKNRDNVLRTPYVNADEKIYDFSNVLTSEEKEQLKERINQFMSKYNMELVIVTYSLPYSSDSENEDFAADFYDYNDFGLEKEPYDGILLFRNTYSADPYYDMYTFGKSQLYFDQTRYDDILDSIYDNLHNEHYLAGFTSFISKTEYYIDRGIPSSMKNKYIDEMGFIKMNYVPPIGMGFIISLITTIIVIGIFIGKNKMVRKATEASTYLNKASLNYTKKQDNFLTSHTTSYTSSSSSGGGGGGGFSSGGSSGGGHSSGGGRHG